MKNMDRKNIVDLINRFISKEDVSISIANEIEVAIDDVFPDDEYMQDTVVMLASYRPGGGEYLYNQEELINRLKKVKDRI
jgi:predicted RNase H-related nuclease YkuK (DUF458 family)